MNDAQKQFTLHHKIHIPPTPAGLEWHRLALRMNELWPQLSSAERFAIDYRGDLNVQENVEHFKQVIETLVAHEKKS